ncbi:phage baseplate assembly protein V [Salmonella enterica]|nr:phage baseplate assembly protein V [Salmonella enterica]EGU0262580.1 phage baseplate assembly protein V [Salmonella enterica]EGV0763610.1 phage baseplate assembly protein V [Salmonella enterica]
MNTLSTLQELARAIRNLIRSGVVTEVDTAQGLCRVQSGGIQTAWLNWLTTRAGRSRTWWAPSVGEQVLLLAIGGELDTAFVLPGIFSDDNPAPSASADAWHVVFPDGAVMEYEPETGALTVSGIKTADVTASESITATVPVVLVKAAERITLDTPEVVCTNKLTTATLEVQKGGIMRGNIEHTGGTFKSNGVQVDDHGHGGVQRGGSWGGHPMTARYLGMNRNTGLGISDSEHISQSMRDILLTPVGSRVMRREYGSLLSALIDMPQNPALRLQIMVACYSALQKWEPRIRLTSISFESGDAGEMYVDITGMRTDTGAPVSTTVSLS